MGILTNRGCLLAAVFLLCALVPLYQACVPGCHCATIKASKRQKGQKVDCSRHHARLKTLADVSFPLDTIHLNLANNALVTLKQASFIHLSRLQKLNLSSNQIAVIEPGAFDGLQHLKKLDISKNVIASINSSMFSGLPKLEKLYLSHNHIAVIPDSTFSDLRSLKHIEFGSEHLHCDCHLKWILKWAKARHVRISGQTKCASPADMKGQSLSKLKLQDLRCEQKVQLPVFDIHPSESQLVFQGDKLPFECHASITPGNMEIAWFRGGQMVTSNKTLGLFVYTTPNLDHTVINHRLVVESLDPSHAGEWSCVVTTAAGNLTKKVHVEVHTPKIVFKCPSVTNYTTKGIYTWNETIAGLMVSQPCQKGDSGAMAGHKCGLDGRWRKLDTSSCSFIKEITCKLSKFAKTPVDSIDVPEIVCGVNKALVAAAQTGESLDSFDIFYMSQIMSLLLPYAASTDGVASLLVNMASNVSSLSSQEVEAAQAETRSPLSMVRMLEQMSQEMSPQSKSHGWSAVSENIAVMALSDQLLYNGFTCILRGITDFTNHGFTGGSIVCNITSVDEKNSPVSIHIPALLVERPKHGSGYSDPTGPQAVYDNPTQNTTEVHQLDDYTDNMNSSSTSNDTSSFLLPAFIPKSISHHKNSLNEISNPNLHKLYPDDSRDFSNKSESILSYPPKPDQSEAMNISSLFTRSSNPFNTSAESVLSLPLSLTISDKRFLPFGRNPGVPHASASSFSQPGTRFILYRNGKLFPAIHSKLGDGTSKQENWTVATPIVAVYTDGLVQNISQPLAVTFTISDTRRPLKAAYFDINSGQGRWRTSGCEIVQQDGSIVTVHVQQWSYCALLQDSSYAYRLAAFRMEPVVYVGSGACILCMASIIVTFTACFRSIGIPKKIKHSIVNVCISTLLLLLVFMFGINRRDMELACQIVGIFIHYLTLCIIFWITVTTNITYKKFFKTIKPPEPPPELIPMPLPPKPILQFYFVGYGIPIIICGITAAVDINFYAGYQYCFLNWEPSLGAFYLPVLLLVCWNLVLFMRISCVVRSMAELDSKATIGSDNEIKSIVLESVPSQADTAKTATHNTRSGKANNKNGISRDGNHRKLSRRDSSDEEDEEASVISLPDQERRPVSQLKSLIAILFSFLIMWAFGALATSGPFPIIPYQKSIFSYIYGFTSSLFGVFMIMYFCVTRKDSLLVWKQAGRCVPAEVKSAPEDDAPKPPAKLPATPPQQPQTKTAEIKPCSNSDLSLSSQKSSNIVKVLNFKNIDETKPSNINLAMPNSSDTSFGSTQEHFPNFYDARQKGAAKKFWQKHRYHSKILNKDINKDLNSSLSDNSVSDMNQRLSRGTSSDANTHLSIEIEAQPKDKPGSYSGSREIPVHVVNPQQMSNYNVLSSSLEAVLIERAGGHLPHEVGQAFNIDGFKTSQSESDSLMVGPQLSPSSDEIGVRFSAFTPVLPHNKNILPRLGKPDGEEGEITQKWQEEKSQNVSKNQLNWSLSQIREVDGQSQGSESSQRPPNPGIAWSPLHCNMSSSTHSQQQPSSHPQQQQHYPFDMSIFPPSLSKNMHIFNLCQMQQQPPAGMTPPAPFTHQFGHIPAFNIPPSPYLIRSQPHKFTSPESNSSHSQSNRRRRSSSGSWCPASESSDGSRHQKLLHSRESSEVTGTSTAQSPTISDSRDSEHPNNAEGHQKTDRTKHSDSDPTHKKRHHHHHHHERHKNKSINRQSSLDWNEQFKDRPSRANYVYVNHTYKDKVMHKLIKQANENNELAKKAFWLPRSASEYERLMQKGFLSVADDTSCSTDEEGSIDDSSWIKQSLEFHKKETSV